MKKYLLQIFILGALVTKAENDIFPGIVKNYHSSVSSPMSIGLNPVEEGANLGFKLVVRNEFDEPVYGIERYFTNYDWTNFSSTKIGLIDNKYLYIETKKQMISFGRVKIKVSKYVYSTRAYWTPYEGINNSSARARFTGKYIIELNKSDIDLINNNETIMMIFSEKYHDRKIELKFKLKKL
ncbi:MAG: hypothetical protein ACRCTZ_19260 [Sarcina sp.]